MDRKIYEYHKYHTFIGNSKTYKCKCNEYVSINDYLHFSGDNHTNTPSLVSHDVRFRFFYLNYNIPDDLNRLIISFFDFSISNRDLILNEIEFDYFDISEFIDYVEGYKSFTSFGGPGDRVRNIISLMRSVDKIENIGWEKRFIKNLQNNFSIYDVLNRFWKKYKNYNEDFDGSPSDYFKIITKDIYNNDDIIEIIFDSIRYCIYYSKENNEYKDFGDLAIIGDLILADLNNVKKKFERHYDIIEYKQEKIDINEYTKFE